MKNTTLLLSIILAFIFGNFNATTFAKNKAKEDTKKHHQVKHKPIKAASSKPVNIVQANKINTHSIDIANSRSYVKLVFNLSQGNYLYADNISLFSGSGEVDIIKPRPIVKEFEIDSKVLKEEVFEGQTSFFFKSPKDNGIIKYSICSDNFCSVESFKYSIDKSTKNPEIEKEYKTLKKEQSFLFLIIIGFIGGLILNLMPCVLPVIALKFSNTGQSKMSTNSFAFKNKFALSGLGMLCFFILLGSFVGVFNMLGIKLDWGFYFANKYFILSVLLTLTIVVASMLGFVNLASQKISHISSLSPFLKGFFVAILGSSCLAPALVVAITMSLSSQGFIEPFITLTAIGLGMSSPYMLINFLSFKLKSIKINQVASNIAKQVLEAFLFATLFWLCYISVRQNGYMAGIISSVIILSIIVFLRLKFYGKYKILSKINSLFYILFAFVLASCVVFGFEKYNQNNQNLEQSVIEELSIQKLDEYVNSGESVFVYITADWCITCKLNNFFVLNKSETLAFFKEHNIRVLKGDLTNRNPEVTYYLHLNRSFGIPFYMTYKTNSNGEKTSQQLPTLIKFKDIYKAFK